MAVASTSSNIYKEVFGTIGLILWSIQLIPQVYSNYKYKLSDGLSTSALLLWISANIFQCVYSIQAQLTIPLILQPHFFMALTVICLVQNYHYSRVNTAIFPTLVLLISIVIFLTGLEMSSIFIISFSSTATQNTVAFLVGIICPVLLSLGFFKQIFEIIKEKSGTGVSKLFIIMDILGGLFCILSLLFHDHFDWVASLAYGSVVILDLILFTLCIYYEKSSNQMNQQFNSSSHSVSQLEAGLSFGTNTNDPVDSRTHLNATTSRVIGRMSQMNSIPIEIGSSFDTFSTTTSRSV